ncbi:MAG TPA: hypothetical protein PKC87_02535 [Candidatus Absconditabacterales bacterium]|nr:hypothetical protein [Candidatus Absconditabacterales bacterium]
MDNFSIQKWQAKHLKPALLTENVQNFESKIYSPILHWLDELEGSQAPSNVLKAIKVATDILEGRAAAILNKNYPGQAPVNEFTEPSQNLVLMVNNYLDSKAISEEEKLEELLELVDFCEQKIEELNTPL